VRHEIIDISPLVSEKIAVYPGDTAFSRKVALDINSGANITLSSITTSVHVGAHADAPNHYARSGSDIASRSLDFYYGPCQVIKVQIGPYERILPAHLNGQEILAPRVLFRTETFSFLDPKWNGRYASLSAQLVHWLADQNVRLVGIDTPSIDLDDDTVLLSHAAIAARDMAILEGLDLSKVSDGLYELIALPLKLSGADASPVRAALIKRSL
jgi:arylformamidase